MLTIIGSALGLLGAAITGGVALWLRNKAAANTPTEKENAVAARDEAERAKVAGDVAKADEKSSPGYWNCGWPVSFAASGIDPTGATNPTAPMLDYVFSWTPNGGSPTTPITGQSLFNLNFLNYGGAPYPWPGGEFDNSIAGVIPTSSAGLYAASLNINLNGYLADFSTQPSNGSSSSVVCTATLDGEDFALPFYSNGPSTDSGFVKVNFNSFFD